MKKGVVLVVILLVVFSFCSTVVAAAPPTALNDVPVGHWAYSAVSKLAKDGIINGYDDKALKGDKTMTRYEMAQIVEKAIANVNKATAVQKTLIDKLSVEFAFELNRIDTTPDEFDIRLNRVENFTKHTLRVTADTLMYFGVDNPPAGRPKVAGNERFGWRPFLYFNGNINDKTRFSLRLRPALAPPGTQPTVNPTTGAVMTQGNLSYIDQAYVNYSMAYGFDEIRIGRQGMNENGSLIAYKSGGLDGITLTKKMNKATILRVGELVAKSGLYTENGYTDSQDYQFISAKSQVSPKVTLMGMYINNNVKVTNAMEGSKVYGGAVAYKMGQWTLLGEYDRIDFSAPSTAYAQVNSPKAYGFQISNGKNVRTDFFLCPTTTTDINKPGDSAFSIAYRYLDPGAAPSGLGGPWQNSTVSSTNYFSSPSAFFSNNRGWLFDYQYVLQKNVNIAFTYQMLKWARSFGSGSSAVVGGDKMNNMFTITLFTKFN